MNWGIFTLLGVMLTVLTCIALFFVHIIRNEKAHEPQRSAAEKSGPLTYDRMVCPTYPRHARTGLEKRRGGGRADGLCPLADARAVHRLDYLFLATRSGVSAPSRNPKADYRGRQESRVQLPRTDRGRHRGRAADWHGRAALGEGRGPISRRPGIHRHPGHRAAIRLERPLRRARTACSAGRT